MFETIVNVDGMMCPMCEKHVNEAIEKAFAPESVSSSHKEKLTRIVSKEALDPEKVKAVIAEAGYTPTGVRSQVSR